MRLPGQRGLWVWFLTTTWTDKCIWWQRSGDVVTSLGPPKETGSYVVWAIRGGPKLDQVQKEYHGRPREPSCFMKPSECNLDSYQVRPAIMGQGCVSKSSTTQ